MKVRSAYNTNDPFLIGEVVLGALDIRLLPILPAYTIIDLDSLVGGTGGVGEAILCSGVDLELHLGDAREGSAVR